MTDRIVKQIELKASPSRVWQALTDYRQFGAWFKVNLEQPFVVGQTARGKVTHPGYEHVEWKAKIERIEPEHLFAFSWHPYAVDQNQDYSGETPTLVEFALTPTA
ncbi:MAG TPA: SRPBCC family protein, partial [Burkholderiaceae bacterium]